MKPNSKSDSTVNFAVDLLSTGLCNPKTSKKLLSRVCCAASCRCFAALAPVFFLRALAAAPRAAPPRFLAALAAFARLLGRSEEDSVFAFQHERLGI